MLINLSLENEFLTFASNPSELEARMEEVRPKTILIDEVQRLPSQEVIRDIFRL